MEEQRLKLIQEIGSQVITLITRSGLTIEEQMVVVQGVGLAFVDTIRHFAAAAESNPDNSN
jgi:hypothetical protein